MQGGLKMHTPVLFLVFNRPDTTAQVFEAIRVARPPRLYVAADGPRKDRRGEKERCGQVRETAAAVDWPCELKTLFRDDNLGCGIAVSTAIPQPRLSSRNNVFSSQGQSTAAAVSRTCPQRSFSPRLSLRGPSAAT